VSVLVLTGRSAEIQREPRGRLTNDLSNYTDLGVSPDGTTVHDLDVSRRAWRKGRGDHGGRFGR
jgi:hypothetical protein